VSTDTTSTTLSGESVVTFIGQDAAPARTNSQEGSGSRS